MSYTAKAKKRLKSIEILKFEFYGVISLKNGLECKYLFDKLQCKGEVCGFARFSAAFV